MTKRITNRGYGRKAVVAILATVSSFCVFASDIPAPVIWWDMETVSNGKIADKSGNGHDLTLGAGATLTNGCGGATGSALFFDGTKSSWASFASPALGSRTIAFWFRREKSAGPLGWDGGNTYPYAIAGFSSLNLHFSNAESGNDHYATSVFASNGDQASAYFTRMGEPKLYREAWTHVALTLDVTGEEAATSAAGAATTVSHVSYTCYINGMLRHAPTTSFAVTNLARTGTGIIGNNAANGVRSPFGALDEFRVWDVVLDADQVRAEYERAKDGYDAATLIGRWTFDDSETVNGRLVLTDVAGQAGNITCGAGIVVTNAGVEGKGIYCNGYKECWGTGTFPIAPSGDFTWTCWVNQSPDSYKDTLAKIGGDGLNRGPRLLQYGNSWYYINMKGAMPAEWDWNRILVLTPGDNGEQQILNSRAHEGAWSHLAVTTRFLVNASGTRQARTVAYMNGEYAGEIAARDLGTRASATGWTLANGGTNGTRPYEGFVDDLRLYAGALSSNAIVRLYRGAAAVDAGADFTVAGATATLRGAVGTSAPEDVRKGYAGTPRWSLVSAPAGGEGATILQPGRTTTQVTLPVEGAYVFRLSNMLEDVGLERHDDVTVARVAAAGAAPAVSVAATGSEPYRLTATVTAGARVSWEKVSGPGRVWFADANGAETAADFGEAGTYVLRCTAEKDGAAATADATVTVGATESCDLSSGLIRWWPLAGPDFTKERIANSTRPTMTNNTEGTVISAFEDGPAGYAMRANGFEAYFNLGNALAETKSTTNGNSPPTERYRAVSVWVWHDSSDTNTFKNAAVFMLPFTMGLWYNCNCPDGTTDGLLLCQQGWGVSDEVIGYMKRPYALPHSLVDRWTHIYALYDRSQGTDFELWIDGEKQTPTSTPAGRRGRVRGTNPAANETFQVGGIRHVVSHDGTDNGYFKNSQTGTLMSRCFPGKVAGVRIWNRKLTAREVKMLASDPDTAANRAPAVDAFSPATVRTAAKKAKAVATAAFDDGLPEDGELTYEWSVLSGDASAVAFGDATARETTFTAASVGTYVLQLAVSDGERTSYSVPLTVEVTAAGVVIVIR